jgi:hypothetical protein
LRIDRYDGDRTATETQYSFEQRPSAHADPNASGQFIEPLTVYDIPQLGAIDGNAAMGRGVQAPSIIPSTTERNRLSQGDSMEGRLGKSISR